MSLIKNKKQREAMILSGQKLAKIFEKISFNMLINKTTKEIDFLVKSLLDSYDMVSQCKGYKKYPGYSCISINDELVHGVPSERKVIETDLVKIDICASFDGFCADSARPYGFFEKNSIFYLMRECAESSLNAGILQVKVGNTVGSISSSIEKIILDYGYSVVKDFSGHGIGKNMHEDPEVPNYGMPGEGQKLYVGMALAIEPMFCQYAEDLVIDSKDKWTVRTKDNGIAMHIEDTVILDDSGVIVTTRLR
jgi:methionyl aminopeptidase